MGKAKRIDLGAINQDRTNKEAKSQPRYNPGQQFFTKPAGQSSTYKMALGTLRGVNIDDPATNDALVFDGTFWIATAQTGTSGSSSSFTLPVTMPVHDLGTVTTSAISHSFAETSAHVLKMILATNTTLTFTNIPSQHIEFELDVTQNGTGGYDLNFAATSLQITGTPTVQSTASRQTVLIGQTHGLTTTSAVFQIYDTALRSAGSSGISSTAFIASWSVYPAISTVEMASFSINSIKDIWFRQGGMSFNATTGDNLQYQTSIGAHQFFVDDIYRFGMDTTNFTYVMRPAGGFIIQTSGSATDVVTVGPNDNVFFDGDVTIRDGQQFLSYENIYIASPSFAPVSNGEFRLVSNDVVVYSGGATHNLSSIGGFASTAFIASWSVYPAISIVDLATFTLDNVTDITQSGAPVAASGFLKLRNNQSLGWHVASTSAVAQGTLKYNASDQFELDSDLTLATNTIFGVDALFTSSGSDSISDVSKVLTFNAPSLSAHEFQIASNRRFRIIGATIEVASATVAQAIALNLTHNQSISESGSDAVYNVQSGSYHLIQTGGTNRITLNATTTTVSNILDLSGQQVYNCDTINFATAGQSISSGGAGIVLVAPAGDNITLQVNSNQMFAANDTIIFVGVPFRFASYTDTSRPSAASAGAGAKIWNTSDAAFNYSDGSNWRIVATGSVT